MDKEKYKPSSGLVHPKQPSFPNYNSTANYTIKILTTIILFCRPTTRFVFIYNFFLANTTQDDELLKPPSMSTVQIASICSHVRGSIYGYIWIIQESNEDSNPMRLSAGQEIWVYTLA